MAIRVVEAKNLLPNKLAKMVVSTKKLAMYAGANSDFTVNNSEALLFPQKVKPDTVNIRVLNTSQEVSPTVMKIMASSIIEPSWKDEELTPNQALVIYLEATTYFFGKRALTANNITKELKKKRVAINFEEIDVSTNDGIAALNEIGENCTLEDSTQLEGIEEDMEMLEGILFTILLLMGKNLVENSVQIWFQKRVQNFCASMGKPSIPTIPQPNLQAVRAIYSRISSLHEVRKSCFRILQRSCSGDDRTSVMSVIALGLLSYTEMGHIQIIFEYIICNYVEVFQSRILQGENTENFQKVLDFIAEVPEPDRPFIELLYTSQQTKVMHREKFPLIIDAAYAVASFMRPSFKNYRGASHDASKVIHKEVTRFLTELSNRQADLMLGATFSAIDSTVKKNTAASVEFFRLNSDAITNEESEERE